MSLRVEMNLKDLLKEAEVKWRNFLKRDFPIYNIIKINNESSKKKKKEDWHFSIHMEKKEIDALIFNEEELIQKFKKVKKYFEEYSDIEELAKDTLLYLLFHETYHLKDCPFSEDDQKNILDAIRKGILMSYPDLSPLKQLIYTRSLFNPIIDVVTDVKFGFENQKRKYLNKKTILVWNIFEVLKDKPLSKTFLTLSDIYVRLFASEEIYNFFKEYENEEVIESASQIFNDLINEFPGEFFEEKQEEYVEKMNRIFSGKRRYESIKKLSSILSKNNESFEGSDGYCFQYSLTEILENLLEAMGQREYSQFLLQLNQELDSLLETEDGIKNFQEGEIDSVKSYSITREEINNLNLYTMHEFYKRNHPSIRIIGKKIGKKIDIFKKQYWKLFRSSIVSIDKLQNLNIKKIIQFQNKTQLPVLVHLKEGTYKINQYKIEEKKVRGITYVESKIEIPDIVEFYIDSSGSMYTNERNKGFNDGTKYDMLCRVLYGFVDTLREEGNKLGKKCKMRIHNFADFQKSSKILDLDEFWKGEPDVLKVLFQPENGYSVEDLNIHEYNDGKERTYVIITDGDLVIRGRTERESQKMRRIARRKNNKVVLFEIMGSYNLGCAVKDDPNIRYYSINNEREMFERGIEVLLYREGEDK